YTSGLGKLLLFLFQQLHILSRAVYKEEYQCDRPSVFPTKLSNSLAILAFNQLKKLEEFNTHRREIARFYFYQLKDVLGVHLPLNIAGSVWLRFPIVVSRKKELLAFAKKRGIMLGDWYDVVTPRDALRCVGYKVGSCPNAEDAAKTIVNLPTYPTLSLDDAKKVVQMIKTFNLNG
ncbi:MAG: DegT/DnrJ/EryC1/StrS family aminotransferase, partial [Patescibacteria group bacterium]